MNYLTNEHGESVTGIQPLPVQSMGSSVNTSTSVTLTYNGKAVAGALTINRLDYAPIYSLEGDRIGSFWGDDQNLVYSTKNIDSLTETAGSAAVVITDPDKDLEKAFETPSGTVKRFVLKVTDDDGGVLYGWVEGIAKSTNAYTFTIYNDRLSEGAQDWVGTLSGFDLTKGAKAEIFKYTSSLAFGTGTTLTEEVKAPRSFSKKNSDYIKWAIDNLSSGQFFVDYTRGMIVGLKADTTASETVTFNANITSTVGSSGATQYAEDSVHQSGDLGDLILSVREDTLGASLAGSNGDYSVLKTDGVGRLYVNNYASASNDTAASNVFVQSMGGEYKDFDGAAMTTVSDEGDLTRFSASAAGIQYVMLLNEDGSALGSIQGDVAHDSADSGSPLKVGFKAKSFDSTAPGTPVAEDDRVDSIADPYGRQYVNDMHPNFWHVSADYAAAQTNTSVKAAPGAGLKLYITDISISNGATAGNITLLDGSGGTVLFEHYPGINGGIVSNLRNPIALTANTALVITSTTVTTHSVNISGFIAP